MGISVDVHEGGSHPRSDLHDVAGPIILTEKQTPQIQRQEDLVQIKTKMGLLRKMQQTFSFS